MQSTPQTSGWRTRNTHPGSDEFSGGRNSPRTSSLQPKKATGPVIRADPMRTSPEGLLIFRLGRRCPPLRRGTSGLGLLEEGLFKDSRSLVCDELCDMRDAACAQGQLGLDAQSLIVDHLGHGPDFILPRQTSRFWTILTSPDSLHSDEPQFPLCLAILLSNYPVKYAPGLRNRQSLPRL